MPPTSPPRADAGRWAKHPLSQVTEDIVRSFRKIGFAVADGPEIEAEHYASTRSIPRPTTCPRHAGHFFLNTNERRSAHAPPRFRFAAEKTPPPVRIIVPGRVYRRDTADATHNPTFHQIEGRNVDKNVTVGDLKGTVEFVFKELLGKEVKLRFRPHYFSYTELSLGSILAVRSSAKWARNGLRSPQA